MLEHERVCQQPFSAEWQIYPDPVKCQLLPGGHEVYGLNIPISQMYNNCQDITDEH